MTAPVILGHQMTRTVMGVSATITVHAVDPIDLAEVGFDLLGRLEHLWSRFIPSSDISRLNNSPGRPVVVDPATVELVRFMSLACSRTHGHFNPTLLPLQRDAGDMVSLIDDKTCEVPDALSAFASMDSVGILDERTLVLPVDMALDAGGAGKGHAADLVAEALLERGADSVSVNIGGDARVASRPGQRHDWNFDIIDATFGATVSTISLRQGAVATSSSNARHRGGRGPAGHLMSLSPPPGLPRTVSVVAGQARWADVLTKYFTFVDPAAPVPPHLDVPRLVVDAEGDVHKSSAWEDFET